MTPIIDGSQIGSSCQSFESGTLESGTLESDFATVSFRNLHAELQGTLKPSNAAQLLQGLESLSTRLVTVFEISNA